MRRYELNGTFFYDCVPVLVPPRKGGYSGGRIGDRERGSLAVARVLQGSTNIKRTDTLPGT